MIKRILCSMIQWLHSKIINRASFAKVWYIFHNCNPNVLFSEVETATEVTNSVALALLYEDKKIGITLFQN